MLNFFVKRPVTTVMFVLFWIALGITSFPRMNVELRPAIDLPLVTATFIFPGASPAELESQVVKRAEDAMSEVAGLKKITSNIFENGAFVMAEFNIGVNVNDKASEIKGKLDALASDFPDDMRNPIVEKLNPLQEPVMNLVLSGADPRDIDRFITDILSGQITAISGVASVDVFGGRTRAVRIQLVPELMAAHGATVLDIIGALGAANLNVPGGRIETARDASTVRFIGEFASVRDIKNLRVSTPEGRNFALSEIATVVDYARDIETGARFNGEDIVMVSVVKASDGNAIRIAREMRQNFDRFEQIMNDYFADRNAAPNMRIVSDSSIAVSDETNSTIYSVLLGILLTILTLFGFTKNWRATVVAGVVIPASLVGGFFFMDSSGFTINAMTLLAMATALGTLIVNAIVLIESSLGFMEAGEHPDEAAIKGTKKAVVPVIAAAGTNIVVFLPLAFMGGIAGQFMSQFGMTVVYLTALSIVFSFTLTPMMIAKILRCAKTKPKNKKADMAWFKRIFDYQMAHPWRVVGLSFVALVLTVIPMRWVGSEFAPNTDMNEITIVARGPAGTSFAKSEQIAEDIEQRLAEFREVEFTSVKIGDRGTQNIDIQVGLIPRAQRISDRRLVQKMLPVLADIPGAEIQIAAGAQMPGMMGDLVMNIYGPRDELRDAYADEIMRRLNRIPEIQSAVLAAQLPGDELKFIPDPEKMKYWGVQNQTAAFALRSALFGHDSFRYREDGHEFPIIIEFGPEYKSRAMFDSVFVPTMKGLVALSELGTVETAPATSEIRRVDRARVTEIGIILGKSTIGPVRSQIIADLSDMDFAAGYGIRFAGMAEMQDETSGEMMAAFLLATILTYILLAAIMNSLAHPLTVATTILFSFAGVFVFLFLTGASMNIAAMLAIVMLVGLSLNNNIIVLEPAIMRIAAGEGAEKALWTEFVDKRRMLYMTTIAVVAGMVPQLWSADGMKISMGAVIVGGMLASLFWTFAMTPAVFMLMERVRPKKSDEACKLPREKVSV